ncbi:hypothetical protein Fcan01_27540 [Folsomia candida]|uniref:Uncharacterized protein n=1 Tax=Folsomia candida TaxID=158441 RepID=A0A226CXK9_FOLCA|nr:hypothetical protein Fcan01_27540 [Folsomia candida]
MSSTKLVRVSNNIRGKKLISSDGNFEEFLSSVRSKFELDEAENITFVDEYGAEVDSDVFPILVSLDGIQNIIFKLEEESSILQTTVQQNNVIHGIVEDCKSKGFVDDKSSTILINEFVSKLIEIKGDSPATSVQKQFAAAIVEILPCWRYSGSKDGLDILFDEVSRSGLIQTRLRRIHQILHTSQKVNSAKKTKKRSTGGPCVKTARNEEPADDQQYESLILLLNGTCAKTGKERLKELITNTYHHRNYLRQSNPQSIFLHYKKFKECDFMISFEFSLMKEESQHNFTNSWPVFSSKLLIKAKEFNSSPAVTKYLAEESDQWDQSLAALFLLLHLIPPAAQGKAKGSRSKTTCAQMLMVSYYKSGTPLNSILDTWSDEKRQPNLICLGEDKKNLVSFFLVVDKILLPIDATNSTEAIDRLFKSHYVFSAEYDKNLQGVWKFLQVFIYKIDVDKTDLSRKIKQVSSQLHGILAESRLE